MQVHQVIFISQLITTLSYAPFTKHHKSSYLIYPKTNSVIVAKTSVLDTIQSLFQNKPVQASNSAKREIENVKNDLLLSCRKRCDRKEIEGLISKLQELSPIKGTAQSSKLQKEWKMEWTTEKEINFFIDWNISNNVYQIISGKEIKNGIEFQNGGGLFVSGSLTIPDDYDGKRTNFKFTTATLDLGGKWGSYTIPPIGEGWFETIYLDDNLRVDINSRNDILICTCD